MNNVKKRWSNLKAWQKILLVLLIILTVNALIKPKKTKINQTDTPKIAAEIETTTSSVIETSSQSIMTTTTQSSGQGDSAQFRAFIDGYEKFMDEYIAFMIKYKSSSNPTDMLVDYTNLLTNYAEYMSKIDMYNEKNLSTADYAYYLEVTTRINKKLLQVQ